MREAEELKEQLIPYCDKIEIAGSIRRRKSECKDIDIVCIPSGSGVKLMQHFINSKFVFEKNGQHYKRFKWNSFNVDLYISTPETFAVTYLIRTGSREHNVKLLSEWKEISKGGFMKDNKFYFANGIQYAKHLNEERDIFLLLGMNYIKPENRI